MISLTDPTSSAGSALSEVLPPQELFSKGSPTVQRLAQDIRIL